MSLKLLHEAYGVYLRAALLGRDGEMALGVDCEIALAPTVYVV